MSAEVETVDVEKRTDERPDLKTAKMTVGGLDIEVRVPDENQLAMYRRVQRRFALAAKMESQGGEGLDATQVADMLNNLFDVITSIIIDKDDAGYLEERVLSGEVKLMDLMPVFTAGIESLKAANQDEMNRAERREAGKSKLVIDAQV